MESPRVFLTGANRGLGLGFVRWWAGRGARVFAGTRDPARATELAEVAAASEGRVTVVPCDVTDEGSVRAAAELVGGLVDGLEVVLNNAGVGGWRGTVEAVETAEIARVFDVNALGPIRVTKAFLPLLRKGRAPRLVHVSSLMGSIDDNRSGAGYPYRMSKAALNMAARSMAIDLAGDGIAVAAVHPGWVRTDMGGSSAPTSIDEAVAALGTTIEGLTLERSGGFYGRDGQTLPW